MIGLSNSPALHPEGEVSVGRVPAGLPAGPVVVDTHGRRFHVEWDPQAPVTPLGQLVFFSQFLATAGLFTEWVRAWGSQCHGHAGSNSVRWGGRTGNRQAVDRARPDYSTGSIPGKTQSRPENQARPGPSSSSSLGLPPWFSPSLPTE